MYAGTLRALRTHLGPTAPLAVLEDPATAAGLVGWFTGRWAQTAPATFNRHLDTPALRDRLLARTEVAGRRPDPGRYAAAAAPPTTPAR